MKSGDLLLAGILLFLVMATSTFDIFLSVRVEDKATVRLCQAFALIFGFVVFSCCCIRRTFLIRRIPINTPLLALVVASAISTVNSSFLERSLPYFLWTLFNAIFFVYAVASF